MQLEIKKYDCIIFEWIPYYEFIVIKDTENDSLAIWKKGPLFYDIFNSKFKRKSYEKVYLKYFHNSQDITNEV
jgi:hypothetical protein